MSTVLAAVAPKRQRGRLRVDAIMRAGAALFAEKGFDAATMTEIAAQSGTAIGSLYRFFPTKEILADALILRYGERLFAGLDAIGLRAPACSGAQLADALVDLMLALREDRSVAVAQGRIIVSDRSKTIQPLETSVVREVFVKDGDKVKAGQLLIALDSTMTEADSHRVEKERVAALSEVLRARALLQSLTGGGMPLLTTEAVKTMPREAALLMRVIAWSIAWFAGAFVLTLWHDALPPSAVLLAGACVFALIFMLTCWTPRATAKDETRRTGFFFVGFFAFMQPTRSHAAPKAS